MIQVIGGMEFGAKNGAERGSAMENHFCGKKKMRIAEVLKLAALGGLENSYVDGSFRLKPEFGARPRNPGSFRVRSHRNPR